MCSLVSEERWKGGSSELPRVKPLRPLPHLRRKMKALLFSQMMRWIAKGGAAEELAVVELVGLQ
jgi:hypothetical protein